MTRTMILWGAAAIVALALGCKSSEQAAAAPAAKPADTGAKAPAPAPGAYPAPIAIEAEDFKNNVKKGALGWVLVTKPEGFSGKGAMEAKPNDNVLNDEGAFVDESPRLDYEVEFPKAGTYVVWVRGWGETEEDNSCHVGLDGKAVDTADRIAEFSAEWLWVKDTKDGEDAVIKVAAPGKHVLNVWMREDGFVFDRILLTMDPKYTPSGKGP